MGNDFKVLGRDQLAGAAAGGPAGRVIRPHDQRRLDGSAFSRERPPSVDEPHPERRDSRFRVSELARPYLPVHEEERRRVEGEVRRQVDAISKETYDAALERGIAEGRELGRREGRAEVSSRAAPMLDSLESLAREFEGVRKSMYEANERFLIDLVLRITRKVCLAEVGTDAGYVGRLARAMIEQSGARENIRVRIHPAQLEDIAALRAGLASTFGELRNLQVEASAEVAEGACEVDTDFSNLKASMDSQIESLHATLVKA